MQHFSCLSLLVTGLCLAAKVSSAARPHSNRHHLSQRRRDTSGAARPLIYIYDLPAVFNTGLQQYYPQTGYAKDDQYEADRELHEYLLTNPARTLDPCAADLFILPVYTSYMVQSWWFGRFGLGNVNFDTWTEGTHCERGVCNYSGHALRAAITAVRRGFPFWNESDGANHLAIFPTDHGICDGMLLLLHNGTCERMMGAHTQGEWAAPWQDGGWSGDPLEHTFCHRRGMDITIPPTISNGSTFRVVHPLAGPRPISVLLRFTPRLETYWGVRTSLFWTFWNARDTFKGRVEVGPAPYEETLGEMERSVFCVTPPGMSTWTARLFRAIVNGCIPVYMFEDVEMPFEALGVDWGAFSINIPLEMAVNRTGEMLGLLQDLLHSPEKLRKMQDALGHAQRMFKWDRDDPHGAQASSVKAFQVRAAQLAHIRRRRAGGCDAAANVATFQHWVRVADRRLADAAPRLSKIPASVLYEAVVPEVAYPLWPVAPWNTPEAATGPWNSPWAAIGPWVSPWAMGINGTPIERHAHY